VSDLGPLATRPLVERRAVEAAEGASAEVSRLVYWLLGGLAAVILALSTAVLSANGARIAALEMAQARAGERLSALESSGRSVEQRLERIERKLDELIGRGLAPAPAGRGPG
jgi:hypothetical protein